MQKRKKRIYSTLSDGDMWITITTLNNNLNFAINIYALYSYLIIMGYTQELQYDIEMEEKKIRAITAKQQKLAEVYAKKASLPVAQVIEWLETGKVNFSELTSGIL